MRIKAAIFRAPNQPLTMEEVEVDEPGPREVLVRTVASGVRHSDLHCVHGTLPTRLGNPRSRTGGSGRSGRPQREFARRLGLAELAAGTDITAVASGGFSSWERVKDTGWGLQKTLGSVLLLGAVYDRDFRCDEEVKAIIEELARYIALAAIHQRKEIENYLLVPPALQRALNLAVRERSARDGSARCSEGTAVFHRECANSNKVHRTASQDDQPTTDSNRSASCVIIEAYDCG